MEKNLTYTIRELRDKRGLLRLYIIIKKISNGDILTIEKRGENITVVLDESGNTKWNEMFKFEIAVDVKRNNPNILVKINCFDNMDKIKKSLLIDDEESERGHFSRNILKIVHYKHRLYYYILMSKRLINIGHRNKFIDTNLPTLEQYKGIYSDLVDISNNVLEDIPQEAIDYMITK